MAADGRRENLGDLVQGEVEGVLQHER